MRVAGLVVFAAILFAGGFVAARAQSDDLRDQLAALESVASELALRPEGPDSPGSPEWRDIFGYSVSDVTSPIPWRENPRWQGDTSESVLFGAQATEAPQPFGTIEEIAELLRDVERKKGHAEPVIVLHGHFFVFRDKNAADRVARYMDTELRPRIHRSVVIEAEWGAEDGFLGRHLSLARTRTSFWVGRQEAMLDDQDVEVAGGGTKVYDPRVGVRYYGESLLVANELRDGHIELAVDFESRRRSAPIRRMKTRQSGTVETTLVDHTLVQPRLAVVPGVWTTAHRDTRPLRIRAWSLPREKR
ncbi:MAG: hypothetical protein ACYTGZ_02790 [Planctomycetota bacterium]|jgi:hypothetical protein